MEGPNFALFLTSPGWKCLKYGFSEKVYKISIGPIYLNKNRYFMNFFLKINIWGTFGPSKAKKVQKWSKKITKMAKNPFFLKKSDFFLWHSLIIWENACLMFSNLFGRIEKKSKKTLFFIFFLAKFCTIFNFGGLKMLEISIFRKNL